MKATAKQIEQARKAKEHEHRAAAGQGVIAEALEALQHRDRDEALRLWLGK